MRVILAVEIAFDYNEIIYGLKVIQNCLPWPSSLTTLFRRSLRIGGRTVWLS